MLYTQYLFNFIDFFKLINKKIAWKLIILKSIQFLNFIINYSYLKASIGSSFAALFAG